MLGLVGKKYYFVQFGELSRRSEVENAIGQAELAQSFFQFELLEETVKVPRSYRLPNRGYDLDAAARKLPEIRKLRMPLTLVTSLPYGGGEAKDETDAFWLGSGGFDNEISILSTYWVEDGWCRIPLESYIMIMIATSIFSHVGGLEFHQETRGCLFDYCDRIRDAEEGFRKKVCLCEKCETLLRARPRGAEMSDVQLTAARRIFDHACGVRRCFFATPLAKRFTRVSQVVEQAASKVGWSVKRADQIDTPRHIMGAILEAIMGCDLVVADISEENPNVFYEIGYAHALGRDVILLRETGLNRLPFDVAEIRTLFYTRAGLTKLGVELERLLMSKH